MGKGLSSLFLGVFLVSTLFLIGGCQGKSPGTLASTNKVMGDANNQFRVLGVQTFKEGLQSKEFTPSSMASDYLATLENKKIQGPIGEITTVPAKPILGANSLLLEMPSGLVGQTYTFGGVITKVSEHDNPNYGDLKLSDIPPYHVRTLVVGASTGLPQLVFMGCSETCTETSRLKSVLSIPIVGADTAKGSLIVDLAPVGHGINLISHFFPESPDSGLMALSSTTTNMEYSVSTLVFDVDSLMIPQGADATDPNTPKTTFTVRWYLRLTSALDPYFIPRAATDGVGFFMTERSAEPKITRFPLTDFNGSSIKYYIKNVPEAYQAPFKAAFDEWNDKLFPVIGQRMLEYEFIPEGDPRNDTIIAGDIRYNVLEWDLTNKASYGGLGPSQANQVTGETMAAAVLIQGPTIIGLYKNWFKVTDQVKALQAQGRTIEADRLLVQMHREQAAALDKPKATVTMKANDTVEFRIASQVPGLRDPLMSRNDFEDIPPNVSFEMYMPGYFQEMVAHELGHNLGLRHNFRGNLGAADGDPKLGQVSLSVMEYLGRPFRFVDRIGWYDIMALNYGYSGVTPKIKNMFCTDEDGVNSQNPMASAECNENDATNDPFSYFESRLAKIMDRLINRQSPKDPPSWQLADMKGQISAAIDGLDAYAASALTKSSGWTNFFMKFDRPSNAADVRAYVVSRIKKQLCDPKLSDVVNSKADPAVKVQTAASLTAFRTQVAEISSGYGIGGTELNCQ